jgi:hypothetical protein
MKILTTPFRIVFIFTSLLLIFSTIVFSQSASKDFKNSVKFNVSNTLLYDNSYQFSYERIIKENQSLNFFVGYQEFPLITIDLDGVNFNKKSDRKGFSVGADYRFYLGSINKYSAPRGVYLAPFVSFFQFGTDRNINYTNPDTEVVSNANISSKLNLTNFGGELGYQFVLWDRFVIDCVLFGPSITRYNYNIKLDENISGLDENEVYQKIIEKMRDKFPNIGNLSGDEGISKKGVQSVTAIGFRYSISIGYRF